VNTVVQTANTLACAADASVTVASLVQVHDVVDTVPKRVNNIARNLKDVKAAVDATRSKNPHTRVPAGIETDARRVREAQAATAASALVLPLGAHVSTRFRRGAISGHHHGIHIGNNIIVDLTALPDAPLIGGIFASTVSASSALSASASLTACAATATSVAAPLLHSMGASTIHFVGSLLMPVIEKIIATAVVNPAQHAGIYFATNAIKSPFMWELRLLEMVAPPGMDLTDSRSGEALKRVLTKMCTTMGGSVSASASKMIGGWALGVASEALGLKLGEMMAKMICAKLFEAVRPALASLATRAVDAADAVVGGHAGAEDCHDLKAVLMQVWTNW